VPLRPHPTSTLFPYTTLFRSNGTTTRRGWTMFLDQGIPGMELFGDEGKAIRAQALQNAPVKEGVWTHLTFTYDGSGKETGLSLRSEEHTSELQSRRDLVCRLL